MSIQERLFTLGQGGADSTEGVCLDVVWGSRLAQVNANGVEYMIPWVGPAPWPGDRVRLTQAGVGRVYCELVMGSPMGTVSTVASRVATVIGDDGVTYRYPHLGGEPANGDRVRLDHAGRCVIAGAYSTEPDGSDVMPVPEPIPVPPPPPVVGGSATFTATWSGSWRYSSYDTSGIESSYSRVAGFGFGSSVADSIPDTATVRRAELQLTLEWNRSGSGDPIRFGQHGWGTAPGVLSESDLSGSLLVPQGVVTVDVLAFADALKTGSARGFGIYPDESYWIRFSPAPNVRLYMEWG